MPQTFIARRDTAYLLAAGRLALAQQLTTAAVAAGGRLGLPPSDQQQQVAVEDVCAGSASAAAVAGFGDAALAALPRLLDDTVLLRELLAKWNARVAGLKEAAEAEAKVGGNDVDCYGWLVCCCLAPMTIANLASL